VCWWERDIGDSLKSFSVLDTENQNTLNSRLSARFGDLKTTSTGNYNISRKQSLPIFHAQVNTEEEFKYLHGRSETELKMHRLQDRS
jgi:hypothetical protein